MSSMPAAEYFVLASRLIPDLDGGFTISVLRRARDIAAAGARVTLLTVDAGSHAEHEAHRAEWRRRGLLPDGISLRNLFDEAADRWLRDAALPIAEMPASGVERRPIADAAGRTLLELPLIVGDPAWHLSAEPVVIWDENEPVGWLPGFGALYRAWLNTITGAGSVLVCEARQIGELLVADAAPLLDPHTRILHTTHACHVLAPFQPDSPMDAAWTRWLAVADRFDQVLWLTPSQQHDVAERVGAGIRSAVVPHPAPRGEENTPVPGRMVVLCSLIPRKRVEDAVRAAAAVRAVVPDAELHVYGDGAQRQALEALAAELSISDAVVFHGHVSDLTAAWRDADVFVLTSTNEGQPLVVLEALGHGVPVVSYDIPYGPKDTLAHGGGILVQSGDIAALADALVDVVGDRDRRGALAHAGRASAARMVPAASMAAFSSAVSVALAAPVPRPGR